MEEDAAEVYIRHRTELLKAIFDNTNPEQEVGDYLLSKINLENHDITYDKIGLDLVCDSYSNYVLTKAKEKKDEFGTLHGHRPAMEKVYGSNHEWKNRVKRAWNESDNKKYNYKLHSPQKDGEDYLSYHERNLIPDTMKHSLWPEMNSHTIEFDHKDETNEAILRPAEHYKDANPFSEKHHPMRRRKVDTGMPEWESTLRNYYLSDFGWAKKGKDIENAHKSFHTNKDKTGVQDIRELVKVGEAIKDKTGIATGKKEDEYRTVKNLKHGIYHGINKGTESHKMSFLGGNDGHEGSMNHQDDIRIRDFERWKKDYPERVKQLEEDDKDLEEAHFNDRMRKLDSNDIFEEKINPKTSTNVYENIDRRGKSTLDDVKTVPHGHGMGWDTWNHGLEFLNPKERSLVMGHINEHGTDDPAHQSVTLPDGQRIHMHRIKANLQMRNNAEVDHWTRSQMHAGPNKAKHIEANTDNLKTGTEGVVSKALKDTLIKDNFPYHGEPYADIERMVKDKKTGEYKPKLVKTKLFDETAHEALIRNLEEHHEGDKLLEYEKEKLTTDEESGETTIAPGKSNLPPFDARDIEEYQKSLSQGKTMKEAFGKKIHAGSDVVLSPEGLHTLVGYNKNDLTISPHPMFKGQQEPFLEKNIMKEVLKNIDRSTGIANKSKDIRNGMGTFRAPNGPRKDNPLLEEGEEKNYYDHEGKLRTLAYPFSRPFTNRGGAGRPITTLMEILHDFKSKGYDLNHNMEKGISTLKAGSTSPFGVKDADNVIDANLSTVGAYGHLHSDYLPTEQQNHYSALGILSKTDATSHSQYLTGSKKGKGRNTKTNSSDHDSTRSPGLAPLLEYGVDKKYNTSLTKYLTGNLTSNAYTSTSVRKPPSKKRIKSMTEKQKKQINIQGESSVRNLAGETHHRATVNGSTSPPNNPAQRFLNFKDIENNPNYLSTGDNIDDVMTALPSSRVKNPKDSLPEGFFDELLSIQEEIENAKDPEKIQFLRSMLRPLQEQYETATKKQRDYGSRQRPHRDFGNVRRNMEQAHGSDRGGIAEIFRTVIAPAILKKKPDAFHEDNPKALLNILRGVKDAQRHLYVNGDHNVKISAHTHSSEEEDMTSDIHYNLAKGMKRSGKVTDNVIDPSKHNVNDVLEMLDLPNDDAHKKHAQRYLDTLSGPVHGYSLGQLATMGLQWNPKNKEMFGVDGKGDVHTHLDNTLREARGKFPPARKDTGNVYPEEHEKAGKISTTKNNDYDRAVTEFISNNPIYQGLNFLHQNARQEQKLDGYGLQYHQAPAPLGVKSKQTNAHNKSNEGTLLHESRQGHRSLEYHHARRKDIASNILSFDTSPDIDLKSKVEPKTIHSIGWGNEQVKPLRSHEGATPTDQFTSGLMDWGWGGKAEIGTEHDFDGNSVVGTNMGEENFPSVPFSYLEFLLRDSHSPENIQSMLTNAEPFTQYPAQMQQNAYGETPSDDYQRVATSFDKIPYSNLLKNLPKEIPLIEPLHRIFELKDMSELRGFTGEWVVSIHKDGTRCKVSKKNGRIAIEDENGVEQSCSDELRDSFKAACKKNYVVDGIMDDGDFYINDILSYDKDEVTELTTRERIKILRGQFESYHPVFIPSPSDIRITDEVGLEGAVKELGKDSDKLLLRDAKSTYMKGEEKHPKWVLLAKSDILYHVPFTMEIDDSHFIIRLPEDVVKYDIVDEKAVNPVAAIGEITNSDYSIRLAKSLESYWQDGLIELLKEETQIEIQEKVGEETQIEPELNEEEIEEESAGILKPKKDRNLIMKPNDMAKALLLIERALDKMQKGHSNMAGRGLGIDVGGGVESPRGPTSLTAEQSLPDWDMKKRPTEDLEKPEDYPGRKQKKKQNAMQSSVFNERSLDE
ncbi:MAG: hypothetical protein CXT67_00485 [Methanobacteriota archaeon]|nr:MAG: hypothetical protein CXT67_00485 [Euryarchaeota archaeon]